MHPSVNPFTFGNNISDPARFIGRKYEIEQIYTRLRNSEGESSSIVGERRMGKTSILAMLQNPQIMRDSRLDTQYFVPIYVNLEMIDETTTPTQIWKRLLKNIRSNINDADTLVQIDKINSNNNINTFDLNDLFDGYIKHQKRFFFLLLDEFEKITCNPNFGDSFFSGLRSLAIHYNLALVTSSRAPLQELTHSKAIAASPFFNIFATVNLPLLNVEEAHQLVEQAVGVTPLRFRPGEVDYIIRIAGTHPFLLQLAGFYLYQAYSQQMDQNARKQYLDQCFYREVVSHFSYIWDHTKDTQKIGLTALAFLSKRSRGENLPRQEKLKIHEHLKDFEGTMKALCERGLVIIQEGGYRLFSPVYGIWLVNQLKSTYEPQEYESWLQKHETKNTLANIPKQLINEVKTEILPQVSANYRQLLISWLSEPTTITNVISLLRSVI